MQDRKQVYANFGLQITVSSDRWFGEDQKGRCGELDGEPARSDRVLLNTSLSFTPGFSQVITRLRLTGNRLNGFGVSCPIQKAHVQVAVLACRASVIDQVRRVLVRLASVPNTGIPCRMRC